ncbi:MAG: hypothetical protein GY841_09955 [FCB group bacterium]|nr:hypothetical protein [FCB group bacterium]
MKRPEDIIDEEERERIRLYLEKTLGHPVRKQKIKSILVNPHYHGQSKRTIEVGRSYADLEPGRPSEQVIAIFETKLFCVVTKERGAGEGLPYFFTRDTIRNVEYAD